MEEKQDRQKKQSFWTTFPGILTGCAAIITAIAGLGGLITVLVTLGVIKPPFSTSSSLPPPTDVIAAPATAIVPQPASPSIPLTATPADTPSPKPTVTREITVENTPTATPTDTPTPIPQEVQTARVEGPGGVPRSRGFFAHYGYLIAITGVDDNDLTVTWERGGQKQQAQARVVRRGGSFVPEEVALLQITGASPPELQLPTRASTSLEPGDSVERYVAAYDRTPGTVLESGVDKEFKTMNSSGEIVTIRFRNVLITTNISGQADAGAPVIDTEGKVVGMLWGSGTDEAISIAIENIKISFPEAFP